MFKWFSSHNVSSVAINDHLQILSLDDIYATKSLRNSECIQEDIIQYLLNY